MGEGLSRKITCNNKDLSRQLRQQLLFDLLELPRRDLVLLVALGPLEVEQLVVDRKFGREKLVDEGDIVVQAPHLEQLFLAETEPQVPVALAI